MQIAKFFISIFIIFGLGSFSSIFAQKHTFSPEEIKEDMAFLKKNFEKLHPGMYYYVGKERYEQLYDSLLKSVVIPLNEIEAYQKIAPLVIMVKDGHTNLAYGKKYYPPSTKRLPIYLRKIENRYFVAANQSKDSTIRRGAEIQSIDNESIEKIIEKAKSYISVDNDNEEARYYYATSNFPNAYLRVYGKKDSVKITYKLPDSTSFQSKFFKAITDTEALRIGKKRYKHLNRDNLGLKIVDTLYKIAVLDITAFSMKGKFDPLQLKFNRTLKKRFRALQKADIQHLIIDFRGNGGGFVPNISRLLRYISPKPFTLMKSYSFKKTAYFTIAPAYTIIPPLFLWMFYPKRQNGMFIKENLVQRNPRKKYNFKGETHFLIDAGCYSATTFTLALAKDLNIGKTYVGQQVGGATWGSFAGNWKNFKLPHTKFLVHTPLYKLEHYLEKPIENFFLQPTHEVKRTYSELLKNNTNAIDSAIKNIQQLEIPNNQ